MQTEKTKNKVEYIIAIISDFAKEHSLNTMQAYRYLERFKGLDFIDKFLWSEPYPFFWGCYRGLDILLP